MWSQFPCASHSIRPAFRVLGYALGKLLSAAAGSGYANSSCQVMSHNVGVSAAAPLIRGSFANEWESLNYGRA